MCIFNFNVFIRYKCIYLMLAQCIYMWDYLRSLQVYDGCLGRSDSSKWEPPVSCWRPYKEYAHDIALSSFSTYIEIIRCERITLSWVKCWHARKYQQCIITNRSVDRLIYLRPGADQFSQTTVGSAPPRRIGGFINNRLHCCSNILWVGILSWIHKIHAFLLFYKILTSKF